MKRSNELNHFTNLERWLLNKICLIEQVHSLLMYFQDCNCGMLNMLSSIIANFEPIRRNILQMLKPTDIVALWMATKLIITQSEKRAYLSWTREVFEGQCKLNQLRSDGCAITVVGKDLNTFTQAMRSWDYRPCGLRLLIVVVWLKASYSNQTPCLESSATLQEMPVISRIYKSEILLDFRIRCCS